MKRFFKNLFSASKSSHKVSKSAFRPQMEALEVRQVMTCSVPNPVNGVLTITCDNAADNVLVTENHQSNQIEVLHNGTTRNLSSVGITTIRANMGRGNNSFRYGLGGGSDFTDAKTIVVVLGEATVPAQGTGSAIFDLFNDGDDEIAEVRANLNISVLGGSGNDAVTALFGEIDNADVTLSTRLLWGNDRISAGLTGDLSDDADVVFDFQEVNDLVRNGQVVLRGGNDSITVRADEEINIDEEASFSVTMNGMAGADRLIYSYDGEMDGETRTVGGQQRGGLFLRMDGGAGVDVVAAEIALEDGSDGSVDAIVRGGASLDALVNLLLVDNSDGDATILRAQRFED